MESDTLGVIAEAMHGIPEEFINRAIDDYLAEAQDLCGVIDALYRES